MDYYTKAASLAVYWGKSIRFSWRFELKSSPYNFLDFLALLIKFRFLCEKQWLFKQAKTKIDFSILNFSSYIFGRTFQFMCWINLFVSENTFNLILSNRPVLKWAMIWSRCLILLRGRSQTMFARRGSRWSKNVHFLSWFTP